MNNLMANWKTTASGILTVLLVTIPALLVYPPIMQNPKWVGLLGLVLALAKIYISLIQNDAKPAVTSSVTIESTAPVNVPPVVVQPPAQATETKKP